MFTKEILNKEKGNTENIYDVVYNSNQHPEIFGTENHYIEELIKTFGGIDNKQKNLDLKNHYLSFKEPGTNNYDKMVWCINFLKKMVKPKPSTLDSSQKWENPITGIKYLDENNIIKESYDLSENIEHDEFEERGKEIYYPLRWGHHTIINYQYDFTLVNKYHKILAFKENNTWYTYNGNLKIVSNHNQLKNRLIDIYSKIPEWHCKILIIKKINNKYPIANNNWHAVIIGRTDKKLFIFDPKWNSVFFDNDILNKPWLNKEYNDPPSIHLYGILSDSTNWNNELFFHEYYLDLNTIDNIDGTDTNIFVQDIDKIKSALGDYNFIFIDKEKNQLHDYNNTYQDKNKCIKKKNLKPIKKNNYDFFIVNKKILNLINDKNIIDDDLLKNTYFCL